MYLFGSYARGEAKANSDIDLRVEASRIKSLMTFGGLYSELEEALAKKPDLLTTKNPDGDFLEELEKDEVLIYVPRGKYLRPMLRIKGDSLSTVPR
ncbi:MAG: nucleotidyltransferase domain-containing protein [Cloacibacillus sp.]|nr:nucleotidyltransferase domain-containing protein [Cloacibacillus sp.]